MVTITNNSQRLVQINIRVGEEVRGEGPNKVTEPKVKKMRFIPSVKTEVTDLEFEQLGQSALFVAMVEGRPLKRKRVEGKGDSAVLVDYDIVEPPCFSVVTGKKTQEEIEEEARIEAEEKAKAEAEETDELEAKLAALDDMTVPKLKAEADKLGIEVSGKKADILAAVKEATEFAALEAMEEAEEAEEDEE
jgi:hypothetical protein